MTAHHFANRFIQRWAGEVLVGMGGGGLHDRPPGLHIEHVDDNGILCGHGVGREDDTIFC